ncbi:MAG: transcription antitermination factor NusB [Chloroflexi bacterium]|nr:transcription antitermination factor NusB [Chloroflexota bacterium]
MSTAGRGRHPRRRARGALLQVLYGVDTTGHELEDSLNWVLEQTHLSKENELFVRQLAENILAHMEEIDAEIQKYAPNWPIHQLAVIDRNILRLAVYEMTLSNETPPGVAINEAVELAKRFGSESSGRFVNGVLGAAAAAAARS